LDIAENFGTGTDDDVFTEGGVALATLLAGAAEGDSLVDEGVVSDNGCFADDNAHAVVNKHALANGRAGVNFDAGQEARKVGDQAGDEGNSHKVQPVGEPVEQQRLQARVAKQNLKPVASGWIAIENDAEVGNKSIEHGRISSFGKTDH
jgi:hypothetical protein